LILKHRLPSLSGLSKVSAFIHRADIGGVLNVSELNLIKRLIQVQNQFKTFYYKFEQSHPFLPFEKQPFQN
jgi:dsDNA-specific endonuclease/ATPase MutS2